MEEPTLEQVIDEQLVCAHLGTYESFESPYGAVNALLVYYQNIGEYFGNEKTPSWRPIETAPKDGSMFLVFAGGIIATGFWDDEYADRELCGCEVTHWMPLPEPPEEAS